MKQFETVWISFPVLSVDYRKNVDSDSEPKLYTAVIDSFVFRLQIIFNSMKLEQNETQERWVFLSGCKER